MKKTVSLPSFLILLGILLISTPSCNTSTNTSMGLSLDTLELADLRMQKYIDDGELPCIATLVLKDGEVAHQGTFGMANIEEERKLKEDAIYRIYSMSKPITAAALMILYDEEKFLLDDPVEKYIPEFKDTRVWVDGAEVDQEQLFTIRHLLTHTAGFSYGNGRSYVDSLYRVAAKAGMWESATLGDMVKSITSFPLKNQPGSKYEYSVSIDIAGYLVEILSGETFDVFLQTRLFDPLGMDDTGFYVPEEKFERLAMIYTKDRSSGELVPVENLTEGVKKKVTVFSGGGGLVSTIVDYGKFGQMLLNGGELDGVRILEESTVELITTNQMLAPAIYKEGIGYGLGGAVNIESGIYGWGGYASTSFQLDKNNSMVILGFTQYIPNMGVPFAPEFSKFVEKAIIED